jgi:FtsP/CotA-like multicopper oxidase with cupredoxin domain
MTAQIPPMDPRPVLTMVDMGMNMAGMNMGNMAGKSETGGMQSTKMGSASPSASPSAEQQSMPSMKAEAKPPSTRGPFAMPFPQPGPETSGMSMPTTGGNPTPPKTIALREGPQVDNIAEAPTERLSSPGVGLENNGRRVLTYADLRARYQGVDPRPPSREIELHLTGSMERFIWGFNGEKFSDAEPIQLKLGERVRFILVNDTMMAHPIHLHGLWSELENGNNELRPYKHTINVKPGERLSYLVSADAPGNWAYHCHLLYHMEAGMFRTVIVS